MKMSMKLVSDHPSPSYSHRFAIGLVLVMLFGLQPGCKPVKETPSAVSNAGASVKEVSSSAGNSLIVKVDDSNFEQVVLNAQQPVLVDFWAPWCGPCVALGPTIDELAADYQGRVVVCKLNVDEAGQLAGQYGITGIPALLVFQGGEVVDQTVGMQAKEGLAAMLDKALGN
jgi:thioredoxin 1